MKVSRWGEKVASEQRTHGPLWPFGCHAEQWWGIWGLWLLCDRFHLYLPPSRKKSFEAWILFVWKKLVIKKQDVITITNNDHLCAAIAKAQALWTSFTIRWDHQKEKWVARTTRLPTDGRGVSTRRTLRDGCHALIRNCSDAIKDCGCLGRSWWKYHLALRC